MRRTDVRTTLNAWKGMLAEQAWPMLAGTVSVVMALLVASTLNNWLGVAGNAMVFLLAVLWSGLHHGRVASLYTACLAGFFANYFFYKPYYGFGLASTKGAVTLGVFALVAFTIATLITRIREEAAKHREQRDVARKRSDELAFLLSLSQVISGSKSVAELRAAFEEKLGALLGSHATLQIEPALPTAGATLLPLSSPDGPQAWLELADPRAVQRLSPEMVKAMAELVAITIERLRLRNEMVKIRVQAENERFRAALLSSISHDFRTPLGSIIGAASTLMSEDAEIGERARTNLLTTILQSAGRLNRFVRNVLDLTRIEADAVAPNLDWTEIGEIIGSALDETEELLAGWDVLMDIEENLPLLRLDFILTEHVFINLFENAAKFAPPGSRLEISARLEGDEVVVVVFNTGSTIRAEEAEALFEQFKRGGSEVRGSGLGLAICRGFLAAQNASIGVDGGRAGAAFRLRFPVGPERPRTDEDTDE